NVALVGCLPAADSDGFEWRLILERPGHFIDAMAGLLNKAISAEPNEIVPIVQLPLQVAHIGRTFDTRWQRFDRARVVRGINGADVANGAVKNSFVELAPRRVITPAKPSHK